MTNEEAKANIIHAIRWNDMPSKEALEMAIKALKEREPCEDAISRQTVMEHYSTGELAHCNHISRNNLLDFIEQLPPVNPQPKTGRWIYGEDNLGTGRDGWYCNQCGHFEFWDYSSDVKSAKLNLPNPCPNCGAKMIEPQEESEEDG